MDNVEIDKGLITATMKATGVSSGIASATLAISPITTTGAIQWKCKAGATNPLNAKYIPSSCR